MTTTDHTVQTGDIPMAPSRVRLGGDLYHPIVPPGAVARCHGDELIRLVLEVSR